MTVVDLLLGSLAVYRLASLFVYEEGPGRIFDRIRRRAGILDGEHGETIYPDPPTYWSDLLACTRCLSLQLGIGATLAGLVWIHFGWPVWILRAVALPLALSAGAILWERVENE